MKNCSECRYSQIMNLNESIFSPQDLKDLLDSLALQVVGQKNQLLELVFHLGEEAYQLKSCKCGRRLRIVFDKQAVTDHHLSVLSQEQERLEHYRNRIGIGKQS